MTRLTFKSALIITVLGLAGAPLLPTPHAAAQDIIVRTGPSYHERREIERERARDREREIAREQRREARRDARERHYRHHHHDVIVVP